MRFAIVRGSHVVNVIEWDGNLETWQPPEGCSAVLDHSDAASPGDAWDGEKFTRPPEPEREPTELDTLRADVEELKAAREKDRTERAQLRVELDELKSPKA